MKNTEKRNLEYLQLLESLEVMLMNGNSINPNSVIRSAIQVAIGKDVNLNQNNMEQTAVEWLYSELVNHIDMPLNHREELLEQAKAMEKEQSLKMLPYDLDELAEGYANYMNNDNGTSDIDFKEGFQKALELLTFKSE